MAYSFNPSPAESAVLSQIMQHESGGNYTAQNPTSTASGAYQFLDGTWQWVSEQTGIGTQYATAADAPPNIQDINALWLLRNFGPNSTTSWGGPSGPPGGYPDPYSNPFSGSGTQPLIDLSGSSASQPTSDIMSQIESSFTSIDLTNPMTDLALFVAAAAAVFLFAR